MKSELIRSPHCMIFPPVRMPLTGAQFLTGLFRRCQYILNGWKKTVVITTFRLSLPVVRRSLAISRQKVRNGGD